MIRFVVVLLVALFAASCSGSKYGHYPKVKTQAVANPGKTLTEHPPKTAVTLIPLPAKDFSAKEVAIPGNANIICLPVEPIVTRHEHKPRIQKDETTMPGNGRPGDVTQVNKQAKAAFWLAITTLGTLAAGFWLTPWLLIISLLCAGFAFAFAIGALKQIKKTGEYGRPKAEFALFVSIPVLLLAVLVLTAALLWGGSGIQFGNMVWFY